MNRQVPLVLISFSLTACFNPVPADAWRLEQAGGAA